MLQDIDWAGLSKIDEIGVPMAVGSTLDEHGGGGVITRRLLSVPAGQCFIMTHVGAYAPHGTGLGGEASPALGSRVMAGTLIYDRTASTVGTVSAMPFYRWQALFNASAASTWRNSHPASAWVWKPKWPICLPSGWSIGNAQPNLIGNGSIARGYLIDERAAATMGFDTNHIAATRRSGVVSGIATTSATALIPARTGKSVQILDVFARVQPLATGAANILQIRQTDSKVIFALSNDNPANLAEMRLSPGLFTKPGTGVSILMSSGATNAGAVCIHYRYVDADVVPQNHWWSYVTPTKPGTGATLSGTAFVASTALATYYPAKDVTVASALAGPANQNVLKGYAITASRDSTGDYALFRLGTGATGGNPGYSLTTTPNVGTPVTISETAYSQEQTLWINEDDLSVKSKTNEGFFFEATGVLLAATANASIRNWSCTAWGFTVPAIDRVGTRIRGTAT